MAALIFRTDRDCQLENAVLFALHTVQQPTRSLRSMSQPEKRAAPAATASGPSSRRLTLLALAVPLALAFFGSPDTTSILPASVHSFVQELTSSFDLKSLNTVVPACPSQPPARDIGPDWTPLDEPGYKTLAVERLVGAIRTVSQSRSCESRRT